MSIIFPSDLKRPSDSDDSAIKKFKSNYESIRKVSSRKQPHADNIFVEIGSILPTMSSIVEVGKKVDSLNKDIKVLDKIIQLASTLTNDNQFLPTLRKKQEDMKRSVEAYTFESWDSFKRDTFNIQQCNICSKLKDEKICVYTNCGHISCAECMDNYINNNSSRKCPTCDDDIIRLYSKRESRKEVSIKEVYITNNFDENTTDDDDFDDQILISREVQREMRSF